MLGMVESVPCFLGIPSVSTLFISRTVEFAQIDTCSSLHVLGGSELILLIPEASFGLIYLNRGVF